MVNCGLLEITLGFLLNVNLVDSDVPLHLKKSVPWRVAVNQSLEERGGEDREEKLLRNLG